jgi:hypothetical protein
MAIPTAPMQTIATLIFDGVLDRFPTLKLGVIEQGASWVPSWMRFMDSAFEAFRKNEERLAEARAAAERVRAPLGPRDALPAEDVGWIDRATPATRCACSRPTTRTSRAGATRSSASRRA